MVIEKLKFWCQSVLPLVYDNSLSYYEVLCKVVEILSDFSITESGIRVLYNLYSGVAPSLILTI